jgi:mycoredoxin-dependent peroxiredoxin
MTPKIGQPAPAFELPSTTGEKISLQSLRGRNVVVVFFPFAFTGICTGELCEMRDRSLDFSSDEAVVLGISCDSRQTLEAFAKAENLAMPLLSDFWPHGKTATDYGVFLDFLGAANRGTFIIDREGVLRWSVVTELGKPRDPQDYLKALADIG